MRDPSRILQVLHDRGRRGLGVNKIYKHLCNTELALAAWAQVYDNDGALTPGTDPDDTAEGVSMDYIEETVGLLRSGRYRPKAVRRTYIPKKHGGERPLGLPGFRDKLVGQMVRMLLEAYYEPQFSEHSWGYRPGRSVAGAVEDIQTWKGTTWWIEGDIADCFGSIDHEVMIGILAESIDDDRFLELVRRFLTAGYTGRVQVPWSCRTPGWDGLGRIAKQARGS
jgi:retron-type reverse transcriptase